MFLTGHGVEQSLIRAVDLYLWAKTMGRDITPEGYFAPLDSIETISSWIVIISSWEEEMKDLIYIAGNFVDKSEDPYSVWILTRLLYTACCISNKFGFQEQTNKCKEAIRKIDPEFFTDAEMEGMNILETDKNNEDEDAYSGST